MKFTGERYVPTEGGDIRQEHLHRYAWCSHLAVGKRVVDIACGEGYGSAMLARVAKSVVGIDISPEAVDHAAAQYGSLPRLEFRTGDAAKISLSDDSVDLVVSFETIEHHDRHEAMISEIRRILSPDGLLVISSPNRDIYSERAGHHNEFHVKELDFAEFDALLHKQFQNIRYFGQRLAVGSNIFPLERESARSSRVTEFTDTGEDVVECPSILQDPVYFIAVAGSAGSVLPDTLAPSVQFSEAEDLYTHHIEVVSWARRVDAALSELREKYAQAVRGSEEVSAWANAQSMAAQEAQAAWKAEKGARHAAEQEARRAVVGWQNEKRVREAAEHEVLRQGEEARRAIAEHMQQIDRMRGDLIEVRGEVVKNRARLRVLEQQRVELELIRSSRSWRWTRPLRFVLRTLRARSVNDTDRQRLRQLLTRRKSKPPGGGPRVLAESLEVTSARPAAAALPVVAAALPRQGVVSGSATEAGEKALRIEPAPQLEGSRDYFVWAVIDWHFRIQRPQHLSRELAAAGHRVFYVSNNFVDATEPGFAVEPLDSEGKLFQVHLHLRGAPQIYHAAPDGTQQEQLRASLAELLVWTRTRGCVSLVQHPYWLETARILPDSRLAYDCMDHHEGFADNDADVLTREGELMREADLLIVTSDWLDNETGKYNPRRLIVRNACQYEHFAHRCASPFRDPQGRKVIGYYGAIAEWFDLELVETVAKRFADCLVLLVGNDTTGARARLAHLSNVEFTGEVPYASLPAYLDGFDVCMLPFQIIPLTLATNPVKVYEYLSSGKDVVSVDLPEIRQFGDLVRVAEDHGGFVKAMAAALDAAPDPALIERRRHFAAQQTWSHRVRELVDGANALRGPKVSIIVVTYNNLDLTKTCLASVERLSDYDNLELIVVDNASADGTQGFLRVWAKGHDDRKIILNADNLGFAAGNNLGLAAADGEYLVLLNNDTHVTFGWITTLMGHLRRNEKLGIVGPVTNNIGNEARIDIRYDDMHGMLEAAADYTARHVGQSMPLRTAAFFCVMLRRAVYEKVGPLDEAFGVGFFEDDDYCRRVEQSGWNIACAEDVFVHHHLSASFNKLKQESRRELFERNRALYEAKWGPWEPHKYRQV